MKIKNIYSTVVLVLLSIQLITIKCDSVCDLETLKLELIQDLDDNNMLDCLRKIDKPHNTKETEAQRNKRIAAQWDTSCSFEADDGWVKNLKDIYGVSQLVDSAGEPVKKDFSDQADMCELIRAAVAKNVFNIEKLDMLKLPKGWVDKVQCVGPKGDRYGPQICAATSSGFYNKASWNVMNKSSVILFADKPAFQEKTDVPPEDANKNEPGANDNAANPNSDAANPTELVNDINKFTQEQLDDAGGNIAELINKAQRGQMGDSDGLDEFRRGNVRLPPKGATGGLIDGDEEAEHSSKTHHYFKRVESSVTQDTAFRLMNNGEISFQSEGSRILMGVFMSSVSNNNYSEVCMKMNLNEGEIPESRQCVGNIKKNQLSGVFALKYTDSATKLSVVNQSGGEGKIDSDGESTNLSFGGISFPDNGIFKKSLGTQTLKLPPSRPFVGMPGFGLNINHTQARPAFYIVMANFSTKIQEESSFGISLSINNKTALETVMVRGPANSVGLSVCTVVELAPGSYPIGLNYTYQNARDELKVSSSNNELKYNQSITAFALPPKTKVHSFKVTAPITLKVDSFTAMNLNGTIELENDSHIIIIYHVFVKVSKAPFTVRVRINQNKFFKSSAARVEEENYASVQGYLAKKLTKGTYEFDLEFLSSSLEIFDPASEVIDSQSISMKVIQLP